MPHILSQKLVNLVNLTQVAAKQRVPKQYRSKSFFGHYDVWTYIAEGPLDTNCPKCMELDAQDFMGSHLRQMFPDLVIMDEDNIYPNVHQTLWGKDTCKCVLRRASEPLDSFDLYEGDNLEPYKKQVDE